MTEPLVLWKNEGETPLACIDRARREGKIAQGVKATYAGRLDPMASGVLLVLVGDAVHEKEDFLKLDKEYMVEVLLGVSTDTGDILGKIQNTHAGAVVDVENVQNAIQKCIGTFVEEYPEYSSKPIDGKPSFSLARLGTLFKRPTHTVVVHSIVCENNRIEKMGDVVDQSVKRIGKVTGDFRQDAIVHSWIKNTEDRLDKDVTILTIRVTCGSGAYMRVLAEKIGRLLDVPTLAYSIVRTRVGNYKQQ